MYLPNYFRCTVLLIKAEYLFDFQYTLVDILTVASSQYDGQLVNLQINSYLKMQEFVYLKESKVI